MEMKSRCELSSCLAVGAVTFSCLYHMASAEDIFDENENAEIRLRREAVDTPHQDLSESLESSSSPLRSVLLAFAFVTLCAGCLLFVAWRYHPSSLSSLRSAVSASIRRRRCATSNHLAFGPPVHRTSYSVADEASSWAERLFRTQNEPSSSGGGAPVLAFVDSQIDVSVGSSLRSTESSVVTLDDRFRPLQLM